MFRYLWVDNCALELISLERVPLNEETAEQFADIFTPHLSSSFLESMVKQCNTSTIHNLNSANDRLH